MASLDLKTRRLQLAIGVVVLPESAIATALTALRQQCEALTHDHPEHPTEVFAENEDTVGFHWCIPSELSFGRRDDTPSRGLTLSLSVHAHRSLGAIEAVRFWRDNSDGVLLIASAAMPGAAESLTAETSASPTPVVTCTEGNGQDSLSALEDLVVKTLETTEHDTAEFAPSKHPLLGALNAVLIEVAERHFARVEATLGDRLEKRLADEAARLAMHVAKDTAQCEARATERSAAIEAKITEKSSVIEAKIIEKTTGVTTRIATESAGVTTRIADKVAGLDAHLAESAAGLDARISEKTTFLKGQIDSLDESIGTLGVQLRDVDAGVTEVVTKITPVFEALTTITRAIESLSSRCDALSRRIDAVSGIIGVQNETVRELGGRQTEALKSVGGVDKKLTALATAVSDAPANTLVFAKITAERTERVEAELENFKREWLARDQESQEILNRVGALIEAINKKNKGWFG